MTTQHPLDAFGSHLRELIGRGFPPDDDAFTQFALKLFVLQFEHNASLQKLCRHRGLEPGMISDWRDIPAMPASAFKEFDLTSLAAHERTTDFHSSGTTEHRPSRHFHNTASLEVYEASLLAWFKRHLLPECATQVDAAGARTFLSAEGTSDCLADRNVRAPSTIPILALTPRSVEAPHSSLIHMFETVIGAFGSRGSRFLGILAGTGSWVLDEPAALAALRESSSTKQPMILLGTAFSFVHLLDWLQQRDQRIALPAGSRVMETGGYKGRSRELPKAELHRLITERLVVPGASIVCEYGMSELSSQAYDHELRGADSGTQKVRRAFRFPPWARVQIVSPETGREVAEGESGLIRVLDLANVRSVMAVQTEDLGVRRGEGFDLLGRAKLAEARGCSIMMTEDPNS